MQGKKWARGLCIWQFDWLLWVKLGSWLRQLWCFILVGVDSLDKMRFCFSLGHPSFQKLLLLLLTPIHLGHHPIFITLFSHHNVGKETSNQVCIWWFDWLLWVKVGSWSHQLWCLILCGCWLSWQNKILFFTGPSLIAKIVITPLDSHPSPAITQF